MGYKPTVLVPVTGSMRRWAVDNSCGAGVAPEISTDTFAFKAIVLGRGIC